MNVRKLKGMANELNPHYLLGSTSMHWSEKTKLPNPIKIIFERRSLMIICSIALIIGMALLVKCLSISSAHIENKSNWQFACFLCNVFTIGMWLWHSYDYFLAKRYVRALTILEYRVVKKDLEFIRLSTTDLVKLAQDYLKSLATELKYSEAMENEEYNTRPWKPRDYTSRDRKYFNKAFGLLSALLPINGSIGYYFATAPEPAKSVAEPAQANQVPVQA